MVSERGDFVRDRSIKGSAFVARNAVPEIKKRVCTSQSGELARSEHNADANLYTHRLNELPLLSVFLTSKLRSPLLNVACI